MASPQGQPSFDLQLQVSWGSFSILDLNVSFDADATVDDMVTAIRLYASRDAAEAGEQIEELAQYLKDNASKIIDRLELGVEPSAVNLVMQVERNAAGHKAWSFILMGVDKLQFQAILWLSDTEDIFATLHESLYSPQIEDWLDLATKKDNFSAISAQSLRYLLKLRESGSQQATRPFDEINDDPAHCPACGAKTQEEAGVPEHLPHACQNCRQRTTDSSGKKVHYYNTQMSGGMQALYDETNDFYLNDVGGFNEISFIDGKPFEVVENRFGGLYLHRYILTLDCC